jgi:kumamolisin
MAENRRLLNLTPVMIAALCISASAVAADTSNTITRYSHIPEKVKEMLDMGKLSLSKHLEVTIALKLRNEGELDQKISEIYRPGSPTFHQFMTSDEFKQDYAPTHEAMDAERALLEAQGVAIQSVSENGVFIKAEGSVKTFNEAFHTEIHRFLKKDGGTYFAPAKELELPSDSQVDAVVGLSDISRNSFNGKFRTLEAASRSGGIQGYTPSDFRSGYAIPASATGAGQTLALLEVAGYREADITAYESQFNLPNVPLQNISVDNASGKINGMATSEATMDIELLVGMAPQASKILIYEGAGSSKGLLDIYAKIASDNLAKQISTSIAQPEDEMTASALQAENTVFKQMIAQGQVLYAAAGDTGQDADGKRVGVQDPASQPNVVGVGGTELKLSATGSYVSETTWHGSPATGGGAGGGGISTVWSIPSWQVGAATADTQASTKMRNVPDVSLDSSPDPGYAIYIAGHWQSVAGTSAAAPLWSAFTALVNQQRVANNKSVIGFTDPAIYQLAESSNYPQYFNDVADGSTNGLFKATTGYDNATGWGSFKGADLLQALVNY